MSIIYSYTALLTLALLAPRVWIPFLWAGVVLGPALLSLKCRRDGILKLPCGAIVSIALGALGIGALAVTLFICLRRSIFETPTDLQLTVSGVVPAILHDAYRVNGIMISCATGIMLVAWLLGRASIGPLSKQTDNWITVVAAGYMAMVPVVLYEAVVVAVEWRDKVHYLTDVIMALFIVWACIVLALVFVCRSRHRS